MKKSHLILILILAISPLVQSQSDWRKGYIIKHEGDTIYGLIDDRGSRSNSKQFSFKIGNDAKPNTFLPKDVLGYRFIDGKFYVSKLINLNGHTEVVFLEFMLHGRVDLYHYQNENEYYFMEKDTVLQELKNSEVIIPMTTTDENGRQIATHDRSVDRKEYIGQLSYMLRDGNMQSDIQSSSLEARSLLKIAKKYHYKVCPDVQCVIYEKTIKPVKWNLGFHAGISMNKLDFGGYMVTNFGLGTFIGGRLELENVLIWQERFSFSFDLTLQRYAEYTFSATELSKTTQIRYQNKDYELSKNPVNSLLNRSSLDANIELYTLKAPLVVNYQFSKKKIRPYIGFGFDNMIVLHESKEFVYPLFNDYYKKNYPTYHFGFIGKTGAKYLLRNQHFLYFELSYEYLTNLNINQFYRLTNNSFSLLLGYSF